MVKFKFSARAVSAPTQSGPSPVSPQRRRRPVRIRKISEKNGHLQHFECYSKHNY